jgi:hypothetical protein
VPEADVPVRIVRGATIFTVKTSPSRLAATFSRHQLKVLLLAAGDPACTPTATLGICRIPLALLLSAEPATTSTTWTGATVAEVTEVQSARGVAECVNDSGVFGRIAFKLQLKRLPLSYSGQSPGRAVPVHASTASSTKTTVRPSVQSADGQERLLQVNINLNS